MNTNVIKTRPFYGLLFLASFSLMSNTGNFSALGAENNEAPIEQPDAATRRANLEAERLTALQSEEDRWINDPRYEQYIPEALWKDRLIRSADFYTKQYKEIGRLLSYLKNEKYRQGFLAAEYTKYARSTEDTPKKTAEEFKREYEAKLIETANENFRLVAGYFGDLRKNQILLLKVKLFTLLVQLDEQKANYEEVLAEERAYSNRLLYVYLPVACLTTATVVIAAFSGRFFWGASRK